MRGRWRLYNKIGQLDLQMANRLVIRWLATLAEVEPDHEHKMILAQNVRDETPNSVGSSDPGDQSVQPHRLLRVEAEVSVMVGEVLMESNNGLGVVGAEATQ